MNQKTIFLRHPDFESASKDSLELLVSCSSNALSYAIVDSTTGKFLALFNAQNQTDPLSLLESELKQRKELQQFFEKVQLSYWSTNDLLVPAFLAENANQQWINNFVQTQQHHNLTAISPLNGMVPVVEVPNRLEKILQDAGFNTIVMHHPVEAFLPEHEANTLHIDVQGQSSYFVVHKGGKLLFQKLFSIDGVDEFHYFLLFVKNQLGLENSTSVHISGLINLGDTFYEVIVKHFTGVSFNVNSNLSECLQDRLPEHYFSSLTALSSCALSVAN